MLIDINHVPDPRVAELLERVDRSRRGYSDGRVDRGEAVETARRVAANKGWDVPRR